MNKLEDFLNNKLPEDQDDLVMKEITKLRMDGVRKNYEQKLRKSYGVSKERYKSKTTRKNIFIGLLISILLALAYLFFATNIFAQPMQNHNQVIASYMDNNKIHNYDIVRGGANKEAYNEYHLGNYKEAIAIWENEEVYGENAFYLAMTYLYEGQYQNAETSFSALNKVIRVGDKFYPESQLHHVLTFHLLNEEDRATKIYESWPIDSWMSREYRKILNI